MSAPRDQLTVILVAGVAWRLASSSVSTPCSSLALERAVLPFVKRILAEDFDEDLRHGIQVKAGKVAHEQLARDTGRAYSPL